MKVKILLLFLCVTSLVKARSMEGTDGTKSMNTCGKSCRRSNCRNGMTCHLDEEDGCYECHNCVKHRKYFKQLQPNETYHRIQECVEIKIYCRSTMHKPEASFLAMTAELKSNKEMDSANHVFFVWALFLISLVTNLTLAAAMLHQQCHRKKNTKTIVEMTPMNGCRTDDYE